MESIKTLEFSPFESRVRLAVAFGDVDIVRYFRAAPMQRGSLGRNHKCNRNRRFRRNRSPIQILSPRLADPNDFSSRSAG